MVRIWGIFYGRRPRTDWVKNEDDGEAFGDDVNEVISVTAKRMRFFLAISSKTEIATYSEERILWSVASMVYPSLRGEHSPG